MYFTITILTLSSLSVLSSLCFQGVLGVVIGDGSHTSNLLKAGRERKERTLFSINAPAAAIKDQIVTIGWIQNSS